MDTSTIIVIALMGYIIISILYGWERMFKSRKPLAEQYKTGLFKHLTFYKSLPSSSKELYENTIRNGECHVFDPEEYQKWLRLAETEIRSIRDDKESIFRDYGTIDPREIFVVALEVLFDHHSRLNEKVKDIYKVLCNLLHQAPVRLIPQS